MARLTLDENGAKRRFKLNPGKLTIGSGDAATLRLASPNVAELHAELVFEAGVARLRPRPGVLPPTLGGKALTAETPIARGQVVKIGAASISVEYDEGEGPKSAAGAAPKAARPKAAAPSARAAAPAAARSNVTRQRREVKKGMPTWAVILLIVVGVAAAFKFGGGVLESATGTDFNPVGAKARFEDYWKDADYKGAAKVLEEFERTDLTPEWRREYDGLKGRLDATMAGASKGAINQEATREWQSQLSNYQDKYLASTATRPKARVFVKRLQSFRERYPEFSEREWVDRMLLRYTPLAELTSPATLADLQWEVTTLTAAQPRRYKQAFAAIDQFLGYATGTDRDEALKLKAEQESGQKEFFDERMLDAAVYYDQVKYPKKFDAPKVVELMVQLVIGMADPSLANDAAERLVKMPESTMLAGYKADRPETFERLMENAIVRKRAQELGLID
ncbi:MAG: FHA domain-containing protein [Planctomycetota bacterium]